MVDENEGKREPRGSLFGNNVFRIIVIVLLVALLYYLVITLARGVAEASDVAGPERTPSGLAGPASP